MTRDTFTIAPLWWASGLALSALAVVASLFFEEHRAWVTVGAYALVTWGER